MDKIDLAMLNLAFASQCPITNDWLVSKSKYNRGRVVNVMANVVTDNIPGLEKGSEVMIYAIALFEQSDLIYKHPEKGWITARRENFEAIGMDSVPLRIKQLENKICEFNKTIQYLKDKIA